MNTNDKRTLSIIAGIMGLLVLLIVLYEMPKNKNIADEDKK